jgi:hypothetical protein
MRIRRVSGNQHSSESLVQVKVKKGLDAADMGCKVTHRGSSAYEVTITVINMRQVLKYRVSCLQKQRIMKSFLKGRKLMGPLYCIRWIGR